MTNLETGAAIKFCWKTAAVRLLSLPAGWAIVAGAWHLAKVLA